LNKFRYTPLAKAPTCDWGGEVGEAVVDAGTGADGVEQPATKPEVYAKMRVR